MSYHARGLSGVAARHPIVLRFAELRPEDLAKFVMHMKRAGGDLSHVDRTRADQNERLIGEDDWVETALAEIDYMRHANFTEELQALKVRKRRKEMDARILQGLVDPWKESKGGPLREVILTANKDWFAETTEMGALFDVDERAEREAQFKAHAIDWLQSRFGDAVIHAHADHDETTCHIHAILMPRHEKTSARRGLQRMLQPSAYPLLKSYEAAQDDVGEFFGEIGLKRGVRGAEARRVVLEENEKAREIAKKTKSDPVLQDVPLMREHVPTPVWWAHEIQRLKEKSEALAKGKEAVTKDQQTARNVLAEAQAEREKARQAKVAAKLQEEQAAVREQEAEEIVAVAEAVSSGQIEFDGASVAVTPKLRPPETYAERKVAERLKAPGSKARAFFQSLHKSYGEMRAKADEKAAKRLASEAQAVRVAAKTIQQLKSTLLAAVPKGLQTQAIRDFLKAERAERKMEKRLKIPERDRDL
ncbi:hypothetical protein FAP39_17060 [Shimia litoralis]|uniref:Pre (Mob) type recombination enzyme n=1 Tax=Shimia litoralis TaxID=420403 RepID=A0A4U7MR94_9RHOB|nr:plasmid recombination protein [Shimia litoralis]TKZ15472.1 hypothetical protein FAP39_17060 [Shimia litoralis]